MKDILAGYKVETDNKTVRKSVNEAFSRAARDCAMKLECIDSAKSGFQISKYLNARAKSAVDIPPAKTHSRKETKDESGTSLHPDLFEALKEWRNNKAHELDIAHFQIMHQKTLLELSNMLPQTISALKHVRGIGQKKARIYGDELLELITAYCKMENIDMADTPVCQQEKVVKKKPDTKKITLDLFNQGKSISQIAKDRDLSLSTIESHLAHYVRIGEIPVNELVPQETADLITSYFRDKDDLKMGPVKDALGEKVSWSDIRFVQSHIMSTRNPGKE